MGGRSFGANIDDAISESRLRLAFEHPEYLWLLALLPPMWWMAFRHFGALGRVRGIVATLIRTLVVVAVTFAVAGVQWVRIHDRVTVMYVLDRSDSIARAAREPSSDYVTRSADRHRDRSREDRAGVVVFGRDAAIDVPPLGEDLPRLDLGSRDELRADATDIAAALELARSAIPSDSRGRIVLVTDGNETGGRAGETARRLAAAGIGLDVVPGAVEAGADVLVEKIDLPTEIRLGRPFDARVVVNAYPDEGSDRPVRGRLSVTRSAGGTEELLADIPVELPAGKSVIPLRHTIDRPLPYTFDATFTPDDASRDARTENNRATAFANVRGKSRVLLIEPFDRPGEWDWLAEQLLDEEMGVVVRPSDNAFGSLAELQAFDSVILANVPRVSGEGVGGLVSFTDAQLEMLVRNTQQLGAGLLMIGGPDSFGAGGWTGTSIERAMPVDFEIKNSVVAATGALMLVMDVSGSMSGEKLEMCKAAAREAVKMLRPSDSVGVLTFDTETRQAIPMQPVGGRTHLMPRISRIGVGGGTDMFPAMRRGFAELAKTDAAVKHMIVLTDGMTPENSFPSLTRRMRESGITVTSVAIGNDADVSLMRQIATLGGGKLYHVLSPRAVPQIVMRESRRIARPLIFEDERGFEPVVELPHAILQGVGAPPPIYGYVLTTAKENPLVQTLITSPLPSSGRHPILATWQYGLGRTAVVTTDGGQRWSKDWKEWAGGRKLFAQLTQWLTRASDESGDFSIATVVEEGEVRVVVNALDENQDHRNLLDMNASVVDPELNPISMEIRQTAPGRYVGSFPVDRAGNYLVQVIPEPGAAPLTGGVTVPFHDEYRFRTINRPLLETLASGEPTGGEPGHLSEPISESGLETLLESNPFRDGLPSVRGIRDAWPWFVLAGCCLFVGDVMTRRIDFGVGRVAQFIDRLRRRPAASVPPIERLDRLAQAKRQAAAQPNYREFVPDEPPPARGDGLFEQVEHRRTGRTSGTGRACRRSRSDGSRRDASVLHRATAGSEAAGTSIGKGKPNRSQLGVRNPS